MNGLKTTPTVGLRSIVRPREMDTWIGGEFVVVGSGVWRGRGGTVGVGVDEVAGAVYGVDYEGGVVGEAHAGLVGLFAHKPE